MVPVLETKLVLVGNGTVGKTLFYASLIYGEFPESLPETDVDNWQGTYISSNLHCSLLSIWDTPGRVGYARIRTQTYPNTDVFLVMFSVVDGASFMNVKEKWIPEIRKVLPFAPALLVGTKNDLRGKKKNIKREISQEHAKELALELGLIGYVECSAKYGTGIREVLDAALLHVRSSEKKKEKKDCWIM